MAFKYSVDLDDFEFVSADMLFDGLAIAEERNDYGTVALIGLDALDLDIHSGDDECFAFQAVWETASRILDDKHRQQG